MWHGKLVDVVVVAVVLVVAVAVVLVDVLVLVIVHAPHRYGQSVRTVGPVIEWLHRSLAIPSVLHTSGSCAMMLQSTSVPGMLVPSSTVEELTVEDKPETEPEDKPETEPENEPEPELEPEPGVASWLESAQHLTFCLFPVQIILSSQPSPLIAMKPPGHSIDVQMCVESNPQPVADAAGTSAISQSRAPTAEQTALADS